MTSNKPVRGSTTLVSEKRFRAHGRVDMWMQDNALLYEATGPFNEEVVELLAVAQMDFLKTLTIDGPWVSICTLKISAMCTPAGLQRYTELMESPKPADLTPVATAFVIGPEIEGGRIMAPYFANVYAAINRPFKTFDTMAAAQEWGQSMVAANRQNT